MSEQRDEEAVNTTNAWNLKVIEDFRANEGKLGGNFEGAPVLLLHTTGAKSGKARINPMMYLELDGRLFVFASKAGADTNPDWFHNLLATPKVSIELGTQSFDATATPLTGEDRDRVYAMQGERFPGFADYATKTTRVIPVVELVRD
jgi:deazaflavin-dependent oxidoreductase (nitroreductase family)